MTGSDRAQPNPAPAVFIGHGAPVYALWPNPFTPTWRAFATSLPRPQAVLVISAHWYGPGLAVTADDHPRTIHDFMGFDREFFEIQYPAPGAPSLVDRVEKAVDMWPVAASTEWGLDHGAWTVLMHIWPDADIPVAQLRIDSRLDASQQIDLGARLAPLRDEGVMLLGSGNIVHNLSAMHIDELGFASKEAAPWNKRFDEHIAAAIADRDLDALARWEEHPDAELANPTPEHFLPALIVAGASRPGDKLRTITQGPDAWSLSMRSFAFA